MSNTSILIIEKYLKKPINDFKHITTGRDYDIFIVEDLVFRFPKNEKPLEELQQEKKKLDIIRKYSTFQIPHYIYIDENMIVYPLIIGEPMKVFSSENITQVIKFIQELHGIDLSKFNYIEQEDHNGLQSFTQQMKETISQRLAIKEINSSTIHNIHKYIDELFFQFKPTKKVMTHGDLQPKNIIIAPNEIKISGIIDFSDSRIGSPELDFCHFLFHPKDLIKQAIEMYCGYYDKNFYDKVFFLGRREILFQITNDEIYTNNFQAIYDNLIKFKFL